MLCASLGHRGHPELWEFRLGLVPYLRGDSWSIVVSLFLLSQKVKVSKKVVLPQSGTTRLARCQCQSYPAIGARLDIYICTLVRGVDPSSIKFSSLCLWNCFSSIRISIDR